MLLGQPLERNPHLLRRLTARPPTRATQQSQAVATLRSLHAADAAGARRARQHWAQPLPLLHAASHNIGQGEVENR